MNGLDPIQLKQLSGLCAAALNYRALAFDAQFGQSGQVKKFQCAGPQRKFAALLVCESFGLGQEWGQLDAMAFHKILAHGDDASVWRIKFLHGLMAQFVRAGWMVVDGTGRFRLRPDQWPNWSEVKELIRVRDYARLDFAADLGLNAMLAKLSQGAAAGQCEFFANAPPAPPPPGSRNDGGGAFLRPLRKTFAENSAVNSRSPCGLPPPLKALKEEHKGIKPLMELESLSDALLDVERGDEASAYRAMCGILGGVVMEGGDLDRFQRVRIGDGGKWRNRWLTNRARTFRVLAALVEELKAGKVKSRGGQAEQIWKEFAEATK